MHKTCTTCGASKPLDAFHKLKVGKHGVRTSCKVCVAAYNKANADTITAKQRQWRAANPDAVKKASARWKRENPHRCAEQTKHYQTRKLQATPQWADRERVAAKYEFAALCTKVLGEPFAVDHIVPLTSETVCGLHTHHNLQVLAADINQAKSNRYWPQSWGSP